MKNTKPYEALKVIGAICFFILGAIVATQSILPGLLYAAAGFIILPAGGKLLARITGRALQRGAKVAALAGFFIAGTIGFIAAGTIQHKEEERKEAEAFAQMPKKVQDSIRTEKAEEAARKKARWAEENRLAALQANAVVKNMAAGGYVVQVATYLEENLNDPDSYEKVEWGRVQIVEGQPGFKYLVRHKYRAKNGFGATVLRNQVFCLDSGGNVVNVSDYE